MNTTHTTTAVRTQGGTVVARRGDRTYNLNGAEARKPFVIVWERNGQLLASGCVSRRAADRAVRSDFGPSDSAFEVVEVAA